MKFIFLLYFCSSKPQNFKKMKKLNLILLLAISIMVMSCGSDDDSSSLELTNASISGTYNLTFFEATEVIENSLPAGTVTTTIVSEGDTFGSSNVVFNANGTVVSNLQFRIIETTTFENDAPTEDIFLNNPDNDTDTFTYSVDDAGRTLTLDGDIFDVTLFNDNELRIEFFETEVDGDETITFSQEIRFTRQ